MLATVNNCLSALILISSVVIFGKIVLSQKALLKNKKNIILIVLVCLFQIIVHLNFEGTPKTLLMIMSNIFIYKYIFNISLSKSIFLIFLYMIILTIPEIIEIVVMTKIFGMSSEYFYNTYSESFIANLSICIIMCGITYASRTLLRKIINIKIEKNTKIIIYYILTLSCISIFFYKAFSNIQINAEFLVSIFIIIVFLTITFSLTKKTLENNRLTKEYDKLLEFMTTYENEIEKQRILRHEAKNEFLSIRAKICDNQKNKEIVKYIDEILKEKIEVKQEEYAKFGYLPANGIKGLCYFKIQEAQNKNINVSLNISKRIKDSTIYDLKIKEQRDFGRIIGVLLDNAIESSEISSEKKLGIEAYSNSNKEFKMIISNTFNNDIDLIKLGKEKFSTKGKNRGHGLLLVRHLINQNQKFELITSVQNSIYTQTIIIKKV